MLYIHIKLQNDKQQSSRPIDITVIAFS